VLEKYRDDLLQKTQDIPLMNAGPVTFGVRLSSSLFPNGYEAISYGRGTWLFHMLREMLRNEQPRHAVAAGSDEPFLRALRKLRTEYEGRSITTSELMAVFESELPRPLWYEGHKSLDWFYDGWVNGSAVPLFELRNLRFVDKPGGTVITGTLVQDYAPDTLVTPIPLYAATAGKNVFLGRVFAEGQETAFRITAPPRTRKILLDPERTLLSRNKP
jgi:hypothetical protein